MDGIEKVALLAAVLCAGTACSEGASRQVECAEPMTLTGLDAVLPLIGDAGSWVFVGPYGWERVPAITPDLIATGELLLDATVIGLPEWCTGDCRDEVRFLLGGGFDGLAVEGDVDDDYGGIGDRPLLRVQGGARFRLRPYFRDVHPSGYNFIPVLEVVQACNRDCPETTRRCPEDQVCYLAGEAYCLLCEARLPDVCACAAVAGGGECSYFESGDMVVHGQCTDGVCAGD